jgi:transposase
MLNGLIFRMRSGRQWEKMPERYGPKSTVHDWFQRWVEGGIFEKIWAVLVAMSPMDYQARFAGKNSAIRSW